MQCCPIRCIAAPARHVHWAVKEHSRLPTGFLTWHKGLLNDCEEALHLGVVYKRDKGGELRLLFPSHPAFLIGQASSHGELTSGLSYGSICAIWENGSMTFDVEFYLSSKVEGLPDTDGYQPRERVNRQWWFRNLRRCTKCVNLYTVQNRTLISFLFPNQFP